MANFIEPTKINANDYKGKSDILNRLIVLNVFNGGHPEVVLSPKDKSEEEKKEIYKSLKEYIANSGFPIKCYLECGEHSSERVCDVRLKQGIKAHTSYSRIGDNEKAKEIKERLSQGECVLLINEHDTVYGIGFEKWVKEQFVDLATITTLWYDNLSVDMSKYIVLIPKC